MSLKHFVQNAREADSSLKTVYRDAIKQLNRKVNEEQPHPPTHIPDQKDLLTDVFDTEQPVWVFFFDAGRYDMFEQLVWDYFDGELQRCWNGDIGYTGDWFVRNLSGDYGNRGLFSWIPMREQGHVSYDGREHFEIAPDIQPQAKVEEQLAALGYANSPTEETLEVSPQFVNQSVKVHQKGINGGLIRYLKPHPPFEGLEEITTGAGKTMKTREALQSGDLTYRELTDAYRETYNVAFEHASSLIPELDGTIIITADHGTCLTCGQLFHGRNLEKHDHLTVVPWMEVDQLL